VQKNFRYSIKSFILINLYNIIHNIQMQIYNEIKSKFHINEHKILCNKYNCEKSSIDYSLNNIEQIISSSFVKYNTILIRFRLLGKNLVIEAIDQLINYRP